MTISARCPATDSVETQPRLDHAPCRSSLLPHHPTKTLGHTDPETRELLTPGFDHHDVARLESEVTIQDGGEPIEERPARLRDPLRAEGHRWGVAATCIDGGLAVVLENEEAA